MRLLDLTLDSAAENLALDEALLEVAESSSAGAEVLRLWEATRPAVIVGRSSRVRDEVDQDACARKGIPVLRRCSGGTSVLVGPGCLMYSVVLSYTRRPALRIIEEAHRFVRGHVAAAVSRLVSWEVQPLGTSDLACDNRKFSGNSLRCRRSHLLYHGTVLYDFPLDLIGECLRTPPRQPEYRAGREHGQFVTNISVSAASLRQALMHQWQSHEPLSVWPRAMMQRLVEERYAKHEWNHRR